MSKLARASAASTAFALLISLFAFFPDAADAKTRQATSSKKKSAKSSTPSSKSKLVRSSASKSSRKTLAKSSKSRRQVARSSSSLRSRYSRSSARAARALARKRARARYLAHLRILRARDAALRNIAASNILNDSTQGEDLNVRRIAVDALAGRSGTVVVMEPNTGRILSIVNQQMALGSPVKPCSTVKLVVGLGALHEGVFDPNQDVQLARNGYGMNLTEAMARSNNPFFQVLGRRLGYERIIKYAVDFGFGERTGANYIGESTGFLPDAGEQETGHMSSHGDGFGVTAIQLAAFTAAIANGGNLYIPRVPRTREETMNFEPQLRRKIELLPEDRLRVLSGMTGAVNFGTAKLAYDPIGQVAGKTGTCTGTDKLGLFTSFSSVDRPKLVVTVITTGSTEAGKRAADIAGRVYRALSPTFLKDPVIAPAAASLEVQRRTASGIQN